jgi:hypothetical protein
MATLKELEIDGMNFTADGLRELATAPSLESLKLRYCRCDVNSEALEPLRGRIRRLSVKRWSQEYGEEVVAKR